MKSNSRVYKNSNLHISTHNQPSRPRLRRRDVHSRARYPGCYAQIASRVESNNPYAGQNPVCRSSLISTIPNLERLESYLMPSCYCYISYLIQHADDYNKS